jgi:1-acyl-sn-glycerol-3-phosphate acyltransferase
MPRRAVRRARTTPGGSLQAARRATIPPGRPGPRQLALAQALLTPWKLLTAPVFHGIEAIPRHRPVLFAGNHTLWGVLDIPIMTMGLYQETGIYVRSLGDRAHSAIPLWRDLLTAFGVVEGTPENCRALMRAGESVLVFPGGAREVFKRRGEAYRLLWKSRIGFARLAIEHGYPIVPFSAVGAEECYEILFDGDDLLRIPLLGALVERWNPRRDVIPPLVRGIGPTALPRPQRFYFRFGTPIETDSLARRHLDDAVSFELRERVRAAVEDGIARLLEERRRDPDRDLLSRVRRGLSRAAPG